jgi:hypothetical protein
VRRELNMSSLATVARRTIAALAVAALTALAMAQLTAQQGPVPGRNVNVNGGPTWVKTNPFEIVGDPWRNQTVEPECDVSSRNPAVIVCSGVDYRLVDIPGGFLNTSVPPSPHPDSWNMIAQSRDGGLTWMSRPHPGYSLDGSGTAPALQKYAFSADPTVRFGAAGVMFHLGLAANRGDNALSAIFVSVWMHLNNLEYDPEPVKFTGRLTEVTTGSAGQFRDRPHMTIGETTGRMCTIDVPVTDEANQTTIVPQTVPCTPAYVAYATFVGDRKTGPRSKIYFTKSLNLGKGWTQPLLVSEQSATNQGVQVVAIPGTRRVLLFWRRGSAMGAQTDAIMMAVSNNDGDSFGKATVLAPLCPFDQENDATHFRVRTMPNAAAGPGYAIVAFTDRGVTGTGACSTSISSPNPARVFAVRTDGVLSSGRIQVDPVSPVENHQIFPTVAVGAGRVHVAWMDFRKDESLKPVYGVAFNPREINEADNFPTAAYPERARHTADMWAAEMGTTASEFEPAFQVSQYILGTPEGEPEARQLQWNVPIARNFNKMTIPFNGDFNASRGETIVPIDPVNYPNLWGFNFGLSGPPRIPVFHDFWTDARNMVLYPDEKYPEPRQYTPPSLDRAEDSTVPSAPSPSFYDSSLSREVCDPNYYSGTKNLDIYTARTTQGLYAFAPFNNKSLGYQTYAELGGTKAQQLVQRAFPVVVENTAAGSGTPDGPLGRWFRLSINNQPPEGVASFDQFEKISTPEPNRKTKWDVWIPWKSMIAQTVYAKSKAERAPVRIDVIELDGTDPAVHPASEKTDGLRTTVFLNPDSTAPKNLLQPGQVDQSFDISKYEVHAVKIENVTAQNVSLNVPGQGLTDDELATAWTEPGWKNPGWKNPGWKNPGWKNDPWQYPGWKNPGWKNPGWKNSAWEQPGWKNEALGDTVTGSARYITAQIVNEGCRSGDPTCANTYTAFNANVLVNGIVPDLDYQLVVYKLNPAPAMTTCEPALVRHSQVLVNIPKYNPSAANFNALDPRATFVLAPDEMAYVVLVAHSEQTSFPPNALPVDEVGFTVTPQPFDTEDFLYYDVTCPLCERPPSPLPAPSPSLFIVSNTANSGPGSLRSAIETANSSPGADSIWFAIPGAGSHMISLTGDALPPITETLVIDGTTQPGYAGTPVIELNGGFLGTGAPGLRISSATPGSVVRGLVINRFGSGISVNGAGGATIAGNYIGTNVAGTTAQSPMGTCVGIYGSPNNVIGGAGAADRNVLSGSLGLINTAVDIQGAGATNNRILGNYIGVAADGVTGFTGVTGSGVGVLSGAAGNLVQGNVIGGHGQTGVYVTSANNNTLVGNRIGIGADGTTTIPNNLGISISNSVGSIIGGGTAAERNIISGSTSRGITLQDATDTQIIGNYIGTDAGGSLPRGNLGGGIQLLFGTNTNTEIRGNVISGNNPSSGDVDGILLAGTATGTRIMGNRIGTTADGNGALPNQGNGIEITASATGTIVGGTAAGSGNVISANAHGIYVASTTGGTTLVIQGNYIGTNAGGTAAVQKSPPSLEDGIYITSPIDVTIGGTTPEAGNVISGNPGVGVYIDHGATATTAFTLIQGNLIGRNAANTGALANGGHGIWLDRNVVNATIGATNPTSTDGANTIANNAVNGVYISDASSIGNRIYSNSIFGNGAIGIKLGGSPANDPGDADVGPNGYQNRPVLTWAGRPLGTPTPTVTYVEGDVSSAPSTTYQLQFFSSQECPPLSDSIFLGSAEVQTTSNTYTFGYPMPPSGGPIPSYAGSNPPISTGLTPLGRYITATATDPAGNTSEFSSSCAPVASSTYPVALTSAVTATAGAVSPWLMVNMRPGLWPVSSGVRVLVNASQIGGGAAVELYDRGINNPPGSCDDINADYLFMACPSDPVTAAPGIYSLPVTLIDAQGRNASPPAFISVTVNPAGGYGAVVGSVVDGTGSPLSGLTVTLRNIAGGPTVSVLTQNDGSFRFLSLLPGDYTVRVGTGPEMPFTLNAGQLYNVGTITQ